MFDLDQFWIDSSRIHHLESEIPKDTLDEDVMVGIDEAGRGPVLGPMIYTAAYCPISLRKELENEKFQDSKTLSEKQRSNMFELINKHGKIGWRSTILSPMVISNSMLKRSKYNLNELSHDTAIALIRNLQEKNIKIKEVYLDTVGMPEKYEAKLKKIFPDISKIKVSKKADSIYKIVSVASICAKVLRDHIIQNWKFIENFSYNENDYGSGYPSDPKTKEFLSKVFDDVFGYPTFVRFSWSTVSKIMDEKAIECKWEDDDDDDDDNDQKKASEKNQSIMDFFKNKKKAIKKNLKSSQFFTDKGIEQIKDLKEVFL